MNFLAHLYLSGHNPKVKIGNFIGDFVRGRSLSAQFEPDIVKGIELHREIDTFTDKHPVVLESKIRLRPKYRHYSPVIIDVFYDHFLAVNWSSYSNQSLADFAKESYLLLESYEHQLPEQVNQMMPYMIRGNWLLNYSKMEGIHRSLSGMSRRTPYESKMEEAAQDLEQYYAEFQNEFTRFFPELRTFTADWLAAHPS